MSLEPQIRSPDDITHSMRIEINERGKIWRWTITKTKEEILRFSFKLDTFHKKVTDPNSLFFLDCLKSGISKSSTPLERNWIDYYHDRLTKMIKFHRLRKKNLKNHGLVDSGDLQETAIEEVCLEFINCLLNLREYSNLLKEHFKKQNYIKDKNYSKYCKRFDVNKANSMTKELAKSLEAISKCIGVVHQFIEFGQNAEMGRSNEKLKEGYVYKRTGGTRAINQQFFYICKYFRRLQKRWMFITKDGIGYTSSFENLEVQKMIYFQHNPLFFCDERDTGYPDVIIIRTKVEDFFFHTGSIKKKEQWRKEIDSAFLNYQVLHKSQPSLRTINSTFNIQENNKAKWYVDGCFYFEDIYNDLINANHRVLISDWWFCPHLYLKRPKEGNEDSKIIEVLRTLVKKNKKIEIYIHMYREPTPLDLGSALTESEITEDKILNKNVRILRHPERGIAGAKLLWAHHEKICVIDDRIAYLGGIDLCYGRFDTHEHKLVDDDEKITFFPGPDFSNPRICEVIDMKKHEENQLDRKKPRMPWHDIALRLEGPSAQDVSLHFMDLVNWASRDSANFRRTNKKVLSQRIDYSMSVNQNGADVVSPSAPDVEEIGESREIFQDFLAEERFVVDSTSQCQILRSVGQWSYGWLAKEDSILQTYLKLISESKHFVYIENQFFISSTAGPEVKNGIAQALVDRIKKAYDEDLENKRENPSFRVIVCMPLLPAFEGEVTETTAPVLKIQLYWEYMTIFKGNDSIFKQLAKVMPKPEDYISFYGLRTHGRIDGKPVTEIVYIHSKLMIVDDDIAIMGSANINDRSMAGDHDSEIACCIKDKSTVESKLNGNHFNKGLFAFTLRKEIFKEILGNNFGDLDDPLDKSFLNNLKSRAKKNTETYRKVFKCYPDDTFDSFDELNKKGNKIDPSEFSSLNEISGFIVEFPMKFLEKENLKPSPLSKEGLAPVELWV